MIVKLFAIVVFMAAAIAGVMWVVLELAGAVSEGADWVWYLALGLTVVAVAVVVFAAWRSRTRGMIALTVTATVLLVGVIFTYPTDKAACGPGGDQVANGNGPSDGLDSGALLDDDIQVEEEEVAASDCK